MRNRRRRRPWDFAITHTTKPFHIACCRDVWQHSIATGLHAYLLAIWGWLTGAGWVLAHDQSASAKSAEEAPAAPAQRTLATSRKQQHSPQHIRSQSTDGWCVALTVHKSLSPKPVLAQIGIVSILS